MSILIRDMKAEDVDLCASFINRRMLFEPNRLRDPSTSESTRIARKAAVLRKDLDTDVVFHVAERDGLVVGWSSWLPPQIEESPKTVEPVVIDKERDYERARIVAEEMAIKRKHFLGDRPCWYLQRLFVDPNARRSGIGLQLIRHGLNMIGPAYIHLSSSPTARNLYRQCGFRIVSWWQIDVEDTDEQGDVCSYRYRWPYMTNYWEGKEAEVEAAEKRQPYQGKLDLDPERVA